MDKGDDQCRINNGDKGNWAFSDTPGSYRCGWWQQGDPYHVGSDNTIAAMEEGTKDFVARAEQFLIKWDEVPKSHGCTEAETHRSTMLARIC